MNHSNSGLAHGTNGSPQLTLENGEMAAKAKEIEERIFDETTAAVWDYIKATQENYGGTVIPKSFTIRTPQGDMWTHGNATEHMYETLISTKNKPPALKNSHPNLYAQFILYDYYQSLAKAVSSGITYEKIITSNSWEFIFSKPREKGKNPVVKHAQFRGI